jgi:hypothetical protein
VNPVVAGELQGLDFNFVQPLDNGNQQSPRKFKGQRILTMEEEGIGLGFGVCFLSRLKT